MESFLLFVKCMLITMGVFAYAYFYYRWLDQVGKGTNDLGWCVSGKNGEKDITLKLMVVFLTVLCLGLFYVLYLTKTLSDELMDRVFELRNLKTK